MCSVFVRLYAYLLASLYLCDGVCLRGNRVVCGIQIIVSDDLKFVSCSRLLRSRFFCGLLAQLAVASDLRSGSSGFESLVAYHMGSWRNWQSRLIQDQNVLGSNPREPTIMGRYAQLARARVCKIRTLETPLVRIQPGPPFRLVAQLAEAQR